MMSRSDALVLLHDESSFPPRSGLCLIRIQRRRSRVETVLPANPAHADALADLQFGVIIVLLDALMRAALFQGHANGTS